MLSPVHFSQLRHIARSPAHYRCYLDAPREPTAAMRLGAAVHRMLLGGPPLCVFDGPRRAGKEWEAFKAANDGKEIFSQSEYLAADRIAAAVLEHPFAGRLLSGECERELGWDFLGRRCSSTPDCVNDAVVELKTASTTQPERFKGACLRMAYHAQLAFYCDAVRVATGRDIQRAYIVGVETAAPYCVTVLRLTPATLHEGRKLCRLWMELLLNCESSDEWPGYAQSELSWDVSQDVELLIDGEPVNDAFAEGAE